MAVSSSSWDTGGSGRAHGEFSAQVDAKSQSFFASGKSVADLFYNDSLIVKLKA